jgi:hypothetical protein
MLHAAGFLELPCELSGLVSQICEHPLPEAPVSLRLAHAV